jgi:hypothetical protein
MTHVLCGFGENNMDNFIYIVGKYWLGLKKNVLLVTGEKKWKEMLWEYGKFPLLKASN